MLRTLAHFILAGLLALCAAKAENSRKPMQQTSLLYQIDTAYIRATWLQSLQRDARRALSEEKIGHKGVVIAGNQVQVNLRDSGQTDTAITRLKKLAWPLPGPLFSRTPVFDLVVTKSENGVIIIEPTARGLENRIAMALIRIVDVVRLRVDPDGSVEPQGQDHILVKVLGPTAAEVKARLAITARLTFQLVDISISVDRARAEGVPPEDLILPDMEHPGQSVLVYKQAILSGDDLVTVDETFAGASVHFELTSKGAAALGT